MLELLACLCAQMIGAYRAFVRNILRWCNAICFLVVAAIELGLAVSCISEAAGALLNKKTHVYNGKWDEVVACWDRVMVAWRTLFFLRDPPDQPRGSHQGRPAPARRRDRSTDPIVSPRDSRTAAGKPVGEDVKKAGHNVAAAPFLPSRHQRYDHARSGAVNEPLPEEAVDSSHANSSPASAVAGTHHAVEEKSSSPGSAEGANSRVKPLLRPEAPEYCPESKSGLQEDSGSPRIPAARDGAEAISSEAATNPSKTPNSPPTTSSWFVPDAAEPTTAQLLNSRFSNEASGGSNLSSSGRQQATSKRAPVKARGAVKGKAVHQHAFNQANYPSSPATSAMAHIRPEVGLPWGPFTPSPPSSPYPKPRAFGVQVPPAPRTGPPPRLGGVPPPFRGIAMQPYGMYAPHAAMGHGVMYGAGPVPAWGPGFPILYPHTGPPTGAFGVASQPVPQFFGPRG